MFSEGAGDLSTKQLFRSFRGESSPSASSLRRPMLTTKREKIDPQAERKQIAEIYDLDEDFADESPAQFISSDNFSPIILQQGKTSIFFRAILTPNRFHFLCIAVKSEVKLEDRVNALEIKCESDTKPNSSSNLVYPFSLDEFFDRTAPQLFLLQVQQFGCECL